MNNLKRNTASPGRQLQIAGYLTESDKQILMDHAKTLKQQGGRGAAKELERMNKTYAKYGLSFGKLEGA